MAVFSDGNPAATSVMMSRGADLESFGAKLAGVFDNDERDIFLWKVRLLRSLGYSDWHVEDPCNSLLYGACWGRQMDLLFFALEIARIDPNLVGNRDRAPIGNAAQEGWLQGVGVLLEAGARLNVGGRTWNGTPLGRSFDGPLTDTSHYLLLCGADPRIYDYHGNTSWSVLMNDVYSPWQSLCNWFSFFFISRVQCPIYFTMAQTRSKSV